MRTDRPPTLWTIAGSDSSGGAGLQADVKTANAWNVHAATVVTAVTAQNNRSFIRSETVSSEVFKAQIAALESEAPPNVIKLGHLPGATLIEDLAIALRGISTEVVCDPVLRSSSGAALMSEAALEALRRLVFPLVDVLTPNWPEAEALSGIKLISAVDVERAGERLLRENGFTAVIIKGGHGELSADACDFFISEEERFWLSSPRLPGPDARGTGCTFATALACARVYGFEDLEGLEWTDAAVMAKAFLNQALSARAPGERLLRYQPWHPEPHGFPLLTKQLRAEAPKPFNSCMRELGFYPIVDRAQWLERLIPLGVRTAQLRIKDLAGDELMRELAAAISLGHRHDCQLFINDHWREALELGAYGVHLGQEDIATADLEAIRERGLRLGLSTHSPSELARALALRPSYLALGPIFHTTLKAMRFAPQGTERLAQWCRLAGETPVVAIGGLALEHAPLMTSAGARGIAVVSDICADQDPEDRASAWMKFHEENFR